MNKNLLPPFGTWFDAPPFFRKALPCILLAALCVLPAAAAERQVVHSQISGVVAPMTPVRQSSRWTRLNLAIGLPLRDRAGLTNLLAQLYDRSSTNYHRYLTPEQFTTRFGPTEEDYQAVVHFAQARGLAVTGKHANRMLVDVRGTVADIERVFHVTLNEYQHPKEARTFYAPDQDPAVDLAVPLAAISGLDNYLVPHPCLKPKSMAQSIPRLTGSGPSGAYLGGDFRAAYVPGVPLTGAGQTVGLLEFASGFYPNDITNYETLAGLPSVPVSAVLLDGYNGGAGSGNDEVSLDIEMAISMAPGLAGVLVYEGESTDDILNRMATDDVAKQIGASWSYGIDATSEQIFQQFAAQGQSFFNASGDSDAYTGAIDTPSDDPNITIVGGTTLTTTGAGGAWTSETVWNWGGGEGSSGGISTTYSLPVWQQGIDMTANQGSTTMRNLPDVAMIADNVYVLYGDGQSGAFGGTSCATPLWAAFTALANQLALTNGEPTVGFINPAVYGMGKGSNIWNYSAIFHDITTGNNESPSSPDRFSAVSGYDLCTGWGTPAGSNLLTALAVPEPLNISPPGQVIFTGPVGGPFSPATQSFALTNYAGGTLSWSLESTSSWFNVSPMVGSLTGGGPASVLSVSLNPVVTNFSAGTYAGVIGVTNLTDKFVQSRTVTLAVVTPPVITAQPVSQALLEGMTAHFSVATASNALMFYSWQVNGTNLTDSGSVIGSATSALTVSSVTTASVGAYSVIVSNAAGVLASSNALLTIVPSPPVIVQQPTNQWVLPGAPATFSVAAVGNTPFFYAWQFNGMNLTNGGVFAGVTSSTLTVNGVSAANAGAYSVVVSNALGSVLSTSAVLAAISLTAPAYTLSSLGSLNDLVTGAYPYAPLAQGQDGNFYGTAIEGGGLGYGAIFKATTNGALSALHAFNYYQGAIPYAGLVLGSNSAFYGTAYEGGVFGGGALFKITSSGSFTLLDSFDGNNGMYPAAGLAQGSDGNFYGAALEGGAYGFGTCFRMTPSGALTTLLPFNETDGAYPSPALVPGSDGNFYGTTENGGTNGGAGTVFRMTPAGQLTVLYSFSDGLDGGVPVAGLVQGWNGNFYGTTYEGGANGMGTVFEVQPSGALTTLYSFTGGSDGALPWGGLLQASDGNLYGVTQSGGTYGDGAIFRLSPDGSLTTVAQFDGYLGSTPSAALIQGADGGLYGTTEMGGTYGVGTVFRLSTTGPLQITGQPGDQSSYLGGAAVFTVAVAGGGPVSYQWQQDGVNLVDGNNISGSATATLRITNVAFADAALYSVVVSNAFNSVSSEGAVLEVIYSPAHITSQPASQTCVAGTTVSFSVAAVGDQPLFYQWQANGVNLTNGASLSGVNSSTLTLSNVTLASQGSYSVVISNAVYSVASQPAGLTVVPANAASAGVTTLRSFTGGSDGAFLYGGLMQARDNNLYGTAAGGGSAYSGSIYRMTLSGALTTLFNFNDGAAGAEPYGGLMQATNGIFYGTAALGGADGDGALFKMTTSGVVSALYSFTGGSDGYEPVAGLVPATDGNFYGTALEGGDEGGGALFKLSPGGTFTPLYEFTGESDGYYPDCGLIQGADGRLYGTTLEGGDGGYGTVFCVATNGVLTTLAAFSDDNGANPEAGVIQGGDGCFYGTTFAGGVYGQGTVFRLQTNGALTTLCSFAGTNGSGPSASLLLANDGKLYGTTSAGGIGGQGTAFVITTNGVLNTLIWFDGLNGASPQSALIQTTGGAIYGTTVFGGIGFNASAGGGNGTVFRLIVPTFTNSFLTQPAAIACLPYAANLSGQAIAPAGDTLTFAKVGGPAWLVISTNGLLTGTPTNSNIGTNWFVVSLTDSNGVVATATLSLPVVADPPPTFVSNPFAEPWANVDEAYDESIATNGTAPYLNQGDQLTFAKVSGPAWLGVGPDGTLSGTPEGMNGGTNTFVVSVTDLGGAFNTAVLSIYVNSPPMFSPQSLVKANATVGLPYAGSVATNAVDADLIAGDTLTFYKVTGPAWLTVGGDGTLSGTPGAGNVGLNSFLLLVVDSGGLSGVGNLSLTVNTDSPPVFVQNPFIGPRAMAGQAYATTIATNVSDAISGAALTFAKVSGPGWLSVAANGSISGLPYSANGGTNSFVVSVTDLGGLSNRATFYINVATVPIVSTLTKQGGNWQLNWAGGVPLYQVQATTNLAVPNWQNLGSATSATNATLLPASSGMYYRVQGE